MKTIQETKTELRRKMRSRLCDWFSAPDAVRRTETEVENARKQLESLPAWDGVGTVMIYLNLPREFPTIPLLSRLLLINRTVQGTRRLAVPYCDGNDLGLFLLGDPDGNKKIIKKTETSKKAVLWNENCVVLNREPNRDQEESQRNGGLLKRLVPGAFGILEPADEFRHSAEFRVEPEEIDLILVPGLAFDPHGGRLGKGKGFYDRFFRHVPPKTLLVGLAFDWQVIDAVPMESHDRRVDYVVTPSHCLKTALSQDHTVT